MKLLNDFVKFKTSINLQDKTIAEYEKSISKFIDYIQGDKQRLNNQSLNNITSQDVQNYALLLRETYSINSVQKELAGIKQFFKYLKKRGIVQANPVQEIEMKKDDFHKEKKFMKVEEGDVLFSLAKNNRDKLIIGLGCYNGLRREEIAELNISDINLENNTMTFMRKNQKLHTLKISSKIIDIVRQEVEAKQGKYDKLIGVTPRRVNQIFDELCEEAGLNGEQYHVHNLRAICASNLYANGFNPIQIQRFLNHSSLNTTLIYLDTSMDDFMKKFEEMDF